MSVLYETMAWGSSHSLCNHWRRPDPPGPHLFVFITPCLFVPCTEGPYGNDSEEQEAAINEPNSFLMSATPGDFMRPGTRFMFSDVLHGTRSHVEWNDLTGRGFIY